MEDVNISTMTKSEFKRLTKGAIEAKNESILGLHVIYQQEFISQDSGSLILKIQMRRFFHISGSKILKSVKAQISKFSGFGILKYLRIEIPEIFKDSYS